MSNLPNRRRTGTLVKTVVFVLMLCTLVRCFVIDLNPQGENSDYTCSGMGFHVFDSDSQPIFNATALFDIKGSKWIESQHGDYRETETYSRYDGYVPIDVCSKSDLIDTFTLHITVQHSKYYTFEFTVHNKSFGKYETVILVPKQGK